MKTSTSEPWDRWLPRISIGIGVGWTVWLVIVIAMRWGFSLELEWLEGVELAHAQRISEGGSVYPEPSHEFVPLLYTPGYPWLLGMMGRWIGVGYVQARAVSILALASLAWGVWVAVARAGKPRDHGWIAWATICAGYAFGYRWLDIARPDTLGLAATLWACVHLRQAWGDARRAILAGVLMSIAFWCKQTAFIPIVASGLAVWVVAPRQAWMYVSTVAVLCGGGVLLGQLVTEGWLWTYIYELHQSHAFNSVRFARKSWGMLAHAWPLYGLAGLVGLVRATRPWWSNTRKFDFASRERWRARLTAYRGVVFWGIMTIGAALASAVGYSTQWAEANAFLPIIVFGGVFVGVSLPVRDAGWMILCVQAQLLIHAVLEPRYQVVFDRGWDRWLESYRIRAPALSIPSSRARENAARWAEELAALPTRGYLDAFGHRHRGSVFAPHRPWWSRISGGAGHVSSMGLHDLGRGRGRQIRRDINRRLRDGEFALVWLEGSVPAWMRAALAEDYRLDRVLSGDERLLPMTGYLSRAGMQTPHRAPQWIFVRATAHAPRDPRTEVFADFEDGSFQGFVATGRAFGRDPSRSVARKRPPVGPHGGQFLVSSADSADGLKATGELRSPEFRFDEPGGRLSIALGVSGSRVKGLSVALVDPFNGRRLELPLPRQPWQLRRVDLEIPRDFTGQRLHLEFRDVSTRAAVFADDIWLRPSPKSDGNGGP